jgi:hypothetical protein
MTKIYYWLGWLIGIGMMFGVKQEAPEQPGRPSGMWKIINNWMKEKIANEKYEFFCKIANEKYEFLFKFS